MTKQEAGRLGGKSTASRYGFDYMRAIGHNGGLKGGRPTWRDALARAWKEEERRKLLSRCRPGQGLLHCSMAFGRPESGRPSAHHAC
jgi:hypothetical protein